MNRSSFHLALAFGLMLALIPSASWAHARLKSASPPAEATAKTGLSAIKLVFNETIEPSLSVIELLDAADQVLVTSKGKAVCEQKTCILAVDPLKAGDYMVKYHVLSADGHVVEGKYSFHIVD